MKYSMRIDVSLASAALSVLDVRGSIVQEATLPREPEALAAFVLGLPFEVTAVGLEAGPLSQLLHKALTEAGPPVVLMETRQVKAALKAMPIKTNRRDAAASRACCRWAGSARCTASRSPHRRCARC